MTSFRKALLFGILIAGFGFVLPVLLWRRYFLPFEPVLLTVAVACFAVAYFKNVEETPLKEGIRVGLLWLLVSVMLELIYASFANRCPGSFIDLDTGVLRESTFLDFAVEGLVKYLVIPVVTIGFAALLELRKRNRSEENEKSPRRVAEDEPG